jgi:phosphatidylglycerophosphate synthase
VYKWVPNAITASRGLCGPVVAALLLGPGLNRVAFWVFVGAIVTDLLDGFAARLLDAHSSTGLWLDPLSDKILTDTCWIALWWVDFAPAWLVWTIVLRDAAVLLAWVWAFRARVRWSPSPVGQIMVAFEGISLSVLLFHGPWLDVHWPTVGTVLGVVSLILSGWSLVEYAVSGPSSVTE